jgi:hypothetical protein
VIAEAPDQIEEVSGVLVVQRGGRLVKDQELDLL